MSTAPSTVPVVGTTDKLDLFNPQWGMDALALIDGDLIAQPQTVDEQAQA